MVTIGCSGSGPSNGQDEKVPEGETELGSTSLESALHYLKTGKNNVYLAFFRIQDPCCWRRITSPVQSKAVAWRTTQCTKDPPKRVDDELMWSRIIPEGKGLASWFTYTNDMLATRLYKIGLLHRMSSRLRPISIDFFTSSSCLPDLEGRGKELPLPPYSMLLVCVLCSSTKSSKKPSKSV